MTDTKYYYDIFISCSSKDIEFAEKLAGDLERHGFIVFLDELEIQPGQNGYPGIEKALLNSFKIIYIISPDYLERKWTPLAINNFFDEIQQKNETKIIPLLLKRCHVPPTLKKLRILDLTQVDDSVADNPDFEKIYNVRLTELINNLKNIGAMSFGEYEFRENNDELDDLVRLIDDRLSFYFQFDPKYLIAFKKACYELLANAFEHPDTSDRYVNLEIEVNLKYITVIVTDRGQGFDLNNKLIFLKEKLKKDPLRDRGRGLIFLINDCRLENEIIDNKHRIKAIIRT